VRKPIQIGDKSTIQSLFFEICMDLKVHFCICHAFSASRIMISHKAYGQEQAMNGLSDVRLTMKSGELQQEAAGGHLYAQAGAAKPTVRRWNAFWLRLTTRRALLRLTDEQLKDVGLGREQARREAFLPFWKL
jgi:uncharacterized protein YjiS (DUF1127 family)